jgi:signal transduction histidine kinase
MTTDNSSIPASPVLWAAAIACGVLGVVCAAQMHAFMPAERGVTFWELLVYAVPTWIPWLVATPAVWGLGRRFPLRKEVLVAHLPVHVAATAVVTVIHLTFFAFWTNQASPTMEEPRPLLEFTLRLLASDWLFVNVALYGLVLGSQQAWQYAREAREREVRAAELEGQLQAARFKALKMQLHPHFLFNTLNAISTLVLKEDTRRATEMLNRLSSFLRMALEERDTQTVPLSRELKFAEAYLQIEQVRFGDHLQVEIDVDPEVRALPVPHLILQPVVENAVRHGIAKKDAPGTLRITARRAEARGDGASGAGDGLRLVVEDDGPGLQQQEAAAPGVVARTASGDEAAGDGGEAGAAASNGAPPVSDAPDDAPSGLGLTTTRERLQAAYGPRFHLHVGPGAHGGVRVEMVLPVGEGKSERSKV